MTNEGEGNSELDSPVHLLRRVINDRISQAERWRGEHLQMIRTVVAQARQQVQKNMERSFEELCSTRIRATIRKLRELESANRQAFQCYFSIRPESKQSFNSICRFQVPVQIKPIYSQEQTFREDYRDICREIKGHEKANIWSAGCLYYKGKFIRVGDTCTIEFKMSGQKFCGTVAKLERNEMQINDLKGELLPIFLSPTDFHTRCDIVAVGRGDIPNP
jgi:hypothetical protein